MKNACPTCSKRTLCMGGCPLVPEIVLCNRKERKIVESEMVKCEN
jgi:sulfatase maturation enzyme AslB (radical SAM superfamily)